MKKLAMIGSSGGNLYKQGGMDPKTMMGEIFTQAASAGMEIGFINFIGASRSMDGISDTAPAPLPSYPPFPWNGR